MSDYYYDESMATLNKAKHELDNAFKQVSTVVTHDDPGIRPEMMKELEEFYTDLLRLKRRLAEILN